jgi:hypothetical protein
VMYPVRTVFFFSFRMIHSSAYTSPLFSSLWCGIEVLHQSIHFSVGNEYKKKSVTK